MLHKKNINKYYLFDSSGYIELVSEEKNIDEHYDYMSDLYYLFDDFEIVLSCYNLQKITDENIKYIDNKKKEETGNCLTFMLLLIYLFVVYDYDTCPYKMIELIIMTCENNGNKLKNMINIFSEFVMNLH